MTPQEAFRLGFLARCVENKLTPEQTHELAKTAFDVLEKQAVQPFQAVVDAAKAVGYPTLALGLAAPPAVGGLAAYFNNKATDIDEDDVESIKRQELISQYRRMTDQLNRASELRKLKQGSKRTSQVFL
jgi:hypothetical protein